MFFPVLKFLSIQIKLKRAAGDSTIISEAFYLLEALKKMF